jgi:hypothetical protein
MSEQQFRSTNFRPDTLARIAQARSIISEYEGQKLTARQVYYQFVARDLIPNTPRSYQNLTSMLTDARYAGLVDWDVIEDRGREPDVPSEWDSVDQIVDASIRQFRLPRWSDQPKYVELWVEKQALAGVLAPIASRFHVPLMVNKGYSSASAMKASADRMLEACGVTVQVQCDNCASDFDYREANGACKDCGEKTQPMFRYNYASGDDEGNECEDVEKEIVVLYLGDHDPSGEDMVRDIRDRLTEFGVPNLKVDKIALTMTQIQRFKPPPNPAKITDSRAAAYIEKFGNESWELDALPPRELNTLVERAITRNLDRPLMDAVIARETAERERVRSAIKRSRDE